MNVSQLLGFLGTGLVIVAYVPQVHHVIKEHCSAGISVKAYDLWFTASVLFLIHAVTIEDLIFTIVQTANLVAMGVVLVCVKRFQKQMCRTHLEGYVKQLEHQEGHALHPLLQRHCHPQAGSSTRPRA